MSEEKDADELAAEAQSGRELPPLPPIPLQLGTSNGTPRRGERPAGQWCRDNDVTPPPGSFQSSTPGLAGAQQVVGEAV
jgi:phospholipid/cholesterol/gamma-HCH transport system ATP-binding protein